MVAAKPAPANKSGSANKVGVGNKSAQAGHQPAQGKAAPAAKPGRQRIGRPASKTAHAPGPAVSGPPTLAQTGASPAAASPGAASPGAASPGAAFPGAASPGAAFPGAASPAAAFPGAASPGVLRRPLVGRTAGGYRAIDTAMAGRARVDDARGYPRHARSLSARAARQRMLLLASVFGVVVIASVIAAPRIIQHRVPADPALSAADIARKAAAIWARRWISPSAIIACDPLMCHVLQGAGVPAAQVIPLAPTAEDPENGAVVIATAVVRSQMGANLESVFAPVVLASFGTGTAEVSVRVVAGDGPTYRHQLKADWRARKLAGASLLRNSEISATKAAAAQIKAGNVDSRLLILLPGLVQFCGPIRVLGFAGWGPGHSPGVPQLAAFITPRIPPSDGSLRSGQGNAAMAEAATKIETFLKAQWTALKADSYSEHTTASGRIIVQLDVTDPPQFGAFDGNPVATTPIGSPSS